MADNMENGENMTDVTFEELIDLENEHNAVDTEILRKHWNLSKPLYARRRELIPRIPHFWSLVFEQGPQEITGFIQPSDARFFADYLNHFDVDRFELDKQPKSFTLRFEFGSNPNFEESVLEKKFWWRTSVDGWSGLVSEPVPIRWKEGKDLTNGLTEATCKLWNKWRELGGEEKRLGFSIIQDDPLYTTLKEKLDGSDSKMQSFFTLFTYVSNYRYVSAAESDEGEKQEAERRAARSAGKSMSEPEDNEDEVDDSDVVVCPQGDGLAQLLVEEIYGNAVKYFISAHEEDSEAPSEADFEEGDLDTEDADSESAPSLVAVEEEQPNKRKADGDNVDGKPAKARRKD